MGDGPYAEASPAGSSWPWGAPGTLPAPETHPADTGAYSGPRGGADGADQGGGAGMIDAHLYGTDDLYPYPALNPETIAAMRADADRFIGYPFQPETAARCIVPDCTIPSASDTDPCEAHQ